MCAMPLEQEIEYPASDGQPMAETMLHRRVMTDVIQGLEERYARIANVWAGGNLFVYYEKGNPQKCVAPDVLLVQGVKKSDRDVYLLWEEKVPALIFEITSRKTRSEDTGKKKSLYEQLGVAELVLFDPYGDYLEPRLQGYRLEQGRYRKLSLNRDGSLDLRTVGLTALPEGERLRLLDTASGEKLLWREESDALRQTAEERAAEAAAAQWAAEERAAQEAAARRAAEERVAQEAAARRTAEERAQALAEELARLRGQSKQ
jgi:Uma2 family endonuclease